MTRARLLEAAGVVFAEKGFYGAAVEEIADRAGYTRGAFYSNFSGKDDLFLALFDERAHRQVEEISALMNDSVSPEAFLNALRGRRRSNESDGSWRMLETEFWLYAMRNPEVRPKLAARMKALRHAYRSAIKAQFKAIGVTPPGNIDDLALVVHILDQGIGPMQDIDPSIRMTFLTDALAMLMEAAVALSASREGAAKGNQRREINGRTNGH